jgi:hypothetical protein
MLDPTGCRSSIAIVRRGASQPTAPSPIDRSASVTFTTSIMSTYPDIFVV